MSLIVAVAALVFSYLMRYDSFLAVGLLLSFILLFAVPGALYESTSEVRNVFVMLCTSFMTCMVLACLFTDINTNRLPWVAVAICGIPIILGAIEAVVLERDITADLLVSIAIVTSCYIGEITAAAEIAIIMQIGSMLEEATVSHANNRIAHLRSMKPEVVHVYRGKLICNVPYDDVRVGEIVRINPGENVPVDGTVVSGNTSIDMSSVTGESVPKDVHEGDKVVSGTINMFGSVDVRVDCVGNDSTIFRMAKLIDEADAGKARIVRAADRWAVAVVLIALTASVLTQIITGDVYRAVTVLVVFCPCALILATPTAIMAAAGNMSRHGILVKDAGAIERLAKVDTVLFDKTGTLTTGTIECCGFESADPEYSAEQLSVMVSAIESRSEHPLGKAIVKYAGSETEVQDFAYEPGMGVSGTVAGKTILAGNRRFVQEHCPDNFEAVSAMADRAEKDGYMTVLVGIDGRSAGIVLLSDTVKGTSAYAVRHLWMLGLKRILITGDTKERAIRMQDDLRMDDVVWECLPSDKLDIVSKIDSDGRSCMVGDGINDAPSLKRAGVGISLGGAGSDLAVESSDIVFMNDDLSKLPALIRLCRRTLSTIHLGIAFSLILNSVAMVLAIMGYLGPVAGALVHNIGSVLVIIAATLLLRFDPWRHGVHKVRKTVDARSE